MAKEQIRINENYQIKTDNKWREILSFFDLDDKEQLEARDQFEGDCEERAYFRSDEIVYSLGEFFRLEWEDCNKAGFHGISIHNGGMVIGLNHSNDAVKIGFIKVVK